MNRKMTLAAWFTPALVEGEREFFDTVVMDETVNRFFGAGTRTRKTRPFYYLAGHFLGKFLSWSLFAPMATMLLAFVIAPGASAAVARFIPDEADRTALLLNAP